MSDEYAQPKNVIDHYAVLGNPISHSKSPQIHRAFAQQTGQIISYESTLAPVDGFAATVDNLIKQGFKGANVTLPFKIEAFALCDYLSLRAEAAGAVNTLTFANGKINGDNTDGVGLVNDITLNLGINLQGSRILLLGAGGAAQGVLLPLLNAKPSSITIANRSLEKAHFMAQKFAANHAICNIAACNFEKLSAPFLTQPFDVVINATSAGLTEATLNLSDEIYSPHTLAYDMMYGIETPFMMQAQTRGAQVSDGLGMLVEQAAEAFYLWRNVRPETAPIIKMMRS